MAQESRLVIVIDAKNAERNARNLGNELDNIERKGDFASKSMDGLSVATRQLAGYMAGLVTISASVSKIDAYTNMSNRLKLVTNSQAELNQALDDTFKIAQNSRAAWDGVIQVYQRFSDNAKTLGINMQKTAELTDTVSKAVAISGASAQAAEAALTQFGQALASGQLRGEELNSILEQTPALAKAIAQGMGITVGQLRSVAAEGKITGEVLVDALTKARASVNELFSKTDMTIGQSITYLNNELTKFVGEAGKGSGAATALAVSVKVLAENLELITDAAILVGVAYLTKAIIDKTVAVQAGIASSVASRQAAIAQAEAEVQLLGIEALRARQLVALAATELGLARAEYNGATSANARAVAIQRLTAAEISHAVALKGSTIATENYTLAQDKLSSASSKFGKVASGAFALIGGPIGAITLGVTGLAAGYMYLQHRTEEANKKLEEQMQIAKKTKEELIALKGVQRDVAINDLQDAFEKQNVSLRKLNNEFLGFVDNIGRSGKQSKQVIDIFELARKGAITNAEALERLNKLNILTPEQKKQGVELVNGYITQAQKTSDAEKALKVFGIEVKLAGNAAQNAASQHLQQKDALDGTASAANRASQALQDYRNKQKESAFESLYKQGYLEKGYTVAQANAIYELQKIKGESAILSQDEIDSTLRTIKLTEQLKDKEDAITDAKRKQTQELEKQLKVLQVNSKVQANAAKYNFGGLENKYGLPSGMLSAIHMIESRGNTKAYNKDTGASGGFQFLSGTAKQYGVKDRFDLGQSAEGAAKYLQYLLKLFNGNVEKAVRAYHAGEGNVQKGKNLGKYNNQYIKDYYSYMGGASGYSGVEKDFISLMNDQVKERQKTLAEIKQLQAQFDTETIARSKARDEQIEKATALGQKHLIPEINLRYESQEKIAKLQLDNELNSYKWTEEQKLEVTKQINILRLDADGKFSDDQKAIAKKAYEEAYTNQVALVKLASEQRIFQANQVMYSEIDRIKKRYEFERQEIALIQDEKERAAALNSSYAQQNTEESAIRDQAISDYRDVMGYEESPLVKQFEVLDKMRELDLISEEKYQQDKLMLQTKYSASYMQSMLGGFMSLVDENSSAYAAMFAAQKAFAVAQALMNIPSTYSNTVNAVSAIPLIGPYIAPAMGAAAAALQVAQAASIKSTNMSGFKSGGYTGNYGTNQVAGVVHGQEYVLNAEATKRVGVNTLNAINNGSTIQAEKQAQANARVQAANPQPIENKVQVGIFDDRSDMLDQMRGREGEKIVMYHLRRNGMVKA